MKKIIFTLILSLVLLSFVSCANVSEDFSETDVIFTIEEVDDIDDSAAANFFTWDGTIITGYSELGLEQKSLIIPKKCTGFTRRALDNNEFLEEVIFAGNDTPLEEKLFADCTSLKTVKLPKNISTISDGCFWNCSSLSNITLPDSVTNLGQSAFYDCSSLEKIKFPKNLTAIQRQCFSNCVSLSKILLPDNLTKIDNSAFSGCRLLNEIRFGKKVEYIGDSAFAGCKITDLNLPSSLKEIGENAFRRCDTLKRVVVPDGVVKIGDKAFYDCDKIEEVYLPSSLESIGKETIRGPYNAYKIIVYVKKGSYADTSFVDWSLSAFQKEYY